MTLQGVELATESNVSFWFMCNQVFQASFDLFCVYIDSPCLFYQIAINLTLLIAMINVVIPKGFATK